MSKNPFKRGAAVRVSTPTRRERGKIAAVRATLRGLWYDVKLADGESISVRAAHLALA